MKPLVSKSPTDLSVGDYHQHPTDVAGLRPSTCPQWTFYVRLFLRAQFGPQSSRLPLRQLEPAALLSFCRFLCVTGRHPRDLSAAMPAVSGRHRENLPRYLSREQLQQLLAVFDRRTLLGKRDYAMVLCLARLGLRAGEVAGLPLPEEVGRALAAYLRNAPLTGPDRHLFRTRGGDRPIRCDWLSRRVGVAMARAGVGPSGHGAHVLRRTFATRLVQQGVSLKAVADLLGHASLSTTQVCAKVNLPMLRKVAQPWPGEARPRKRARSRQPRPFICRVAADWGLPSSRRGQPSACTAKAARIESCRCSNPSQANGRAPWPNVPTTRTRWFSRTASDSRSHAGAWKTLASGRRAGRRAMPLAQGLHRDPAYLSPHHRHTPAPGRRRISW